jgi:hypothetical protein
MDYRSELYSEGVAGETTQDIYRSTEVDPSFTPETTALYESLPAFSLGGCRERVARITADRLAAHGFRRHRLKMKCCAVTHGQDEVHRAAMHLHPIRPPTTTRTNLRVASTWSPTLNQPTFASTVICIEPR